MYKYRLYGALVTWDDYTIFSEVLLTVDEAISKIWEGNIQPDEDSDYPFEQLRSELSEIKLLEKTE
jgi:hypothetical protein